MMLFLIQNVFNNILNLRIAITENTIPILPTKDLVFNEFFFYAHKPSLFFAVQIGAIASLFVLYFFFRKYNHPHKKFSQVKPKSFFPAALLILLIAALSFSSYLDPDFKFMAGLITVIFGLVAIAWDYQKNREDVKPMLKRVDWKTGFFLAGIFIMVESLTKTGVIDNIAKLISATIGNNLSISDSLCLA